MANDSTPKTKVAYRALSSVIQNPEKSAETATEDQERTRLF